MTCHPILVALQMCTAEPELPPVAYTEEAKTTCMTKEEARKRWPNDHLYWHTPNRCWDNRPAPDRRRYIARVSHQNKATHTSPARPETKEPLSVVAGRAFASTDANGGPILRSIETVAQRKARIEVYYPPLLQQQAAIAADMYAIRRPITEWPLMLDIDAVPDRDAPDSCCWPNLQILLMEQPK